jgi:hypothetical protein
LRDVAIAAAEIACSTLPAIEIDFGSEKVRTHLPLVFAAE